MLYAQNYAGPYQYAFKNFILKYLPIMLFTFPIIYIYMLMNAQLKFLTVLLENTDDFYKCAYTTVLLENIDL